MFCLNLISKTSVPCTIVVVVSIKVFFKSIRSKFNYFYFNFKISQQPLPLQLLQYLVVTKQVGKVTIGAMTRTTTKVSIIKKSLKLSFLITFFNVQDVIGTVVIVAEPMSEPNTARNANV